MERRRRRRRRPRRSTLPPNNLVYLPFPLEIEECEGQKDDSLNRRIEDQEMILLYCT